MAFKPALLVLVSLGLAAQPSKPSPEALAFASRPWRRINSLAGFPSSVRAQLGAIANQWEDANLTCIRAPNLPDKQLIFGGKSGSQVFAYYIQGMGIVSICRVILFECSPDGSCKKVEAWNTGSAVRLSELTALAKRGEFDLTEAEPLSR